MQKTTRMLTLSALFLALGLILPFLTLQIPQIGSMLLPMHLPVLLCGFICGAPWGLLVGAATPLLRSLIFGMPVMYPMAAAMAIELAIYGIATGFFYRLMPKNVLNVYVSLLIAMVLGRIGWGAAMYFMLGGAFGMEKFLAGAVTGAIPGIILQLLLVPACVLALRKARLMD